MGGDKDSLIGEEKRGIKAPRKTKAITHHPPQEMDAQLVPEQWPLWKTKPSRPISLPPSLLPMTELIEHDVVRYGICLRPIQVSCLSCVHS